MELFFRSETATPMDESPPTDSALKSQEFKEAQKCRKIHTGGIGR
jgi:hypothetical protein